MSRVAVIGIVGQTIFMQVDHFHIGGETVETEKAHFEYGAKGFNQALAAARMGAEVSFLCPLGEREIYDVTALCEKENIKPFIVKKDAPTSFGCVITDKTGANRVTVYKGATLAPEDIKIFEDEIKNADILLLTNEIAEEVNLTAAKTAAEHGTKVILNPAPARKTAMALLDLIYLFLPNEFEADGLDNYTNVIQTLGERGCYIRATGETVPAVKVKAVDTTGAGDTFCGTLAAALALGKSIESATKTAVLSSSISVTRRGAATSIPYKKEIIMQEKLNLLLEKYSVGESAELVGKCGVRIGGELIPLLPFESERRFFELRQLVLNHRIGNISTCRIGHTAKKGADIYELLWRELGVLEYITNSRVTEIFAIAGKNTLNAIAETDNGCVCTLELACTLGEGERDIDKHEIITDSGIACDRVVDTQVPQSSIYVYGKNGAEYTDVDAELYGLADSDTFVVRNAFTVAKSAEMRKHNVEVSNHLDHLVVCAYKSIEILENIKAGE